MAEREFSGKRISEFFFRRSEEDDTVYECKCGNKRNRTGTSYTNLVSHVQKAHPDYLGLMRKGNMHGQSHLDNYFPMSKAKHIHGWIDLIVNGLMPFSSIEKPIICCHVKHEPFSLNTLMKYLSAITEIVERKIAMILPQKICLIFDGWTSDSTHYLGVFATFPSRATSVYEMRLLTVSPLADESRLDTDEHIEYLTYILHLYSGSWSNVICLVGDNVQTNKSISTKLQISLVGCASHRLNLAVQNIWTNMNHHYCKSIKLCSN